MASGLHATKELTEGISRVIRRLIRLEISHLQVNAQPKNEQNVNIKDITSKLFAATQCTLPLITATSCLNLICFCLMP